LKKHTFDSIICVLTYKRI